MLCASSDLGLVSWSFRGALWALAPGQAPETPAVTGGCLLGSLSLGD